MADLSYLRLAVARSLDRAVLRRFIGDDRASMALLFAVLLALGTVVGAFAVDEGSLYLERRQVQAGVDLAALAAAADPPHAFALARRTLADAGLIEGHPTDAALAAGTGPVHLEVATGRYAADPAVPAADRFAPGAPAPNAVHVRFERRGTLYFAGSWSKPPEIGATALAATTPEVTFSVGSTLAALGAGLPNAVLNALLGARVTASAASYSGLLEAQVGVFAFLDALAQELDITAGTYDDVLAASAGRGAIARALARSLTGSAGTAARAIAAALGPGGAVPLARLFDLGAAGRLALGTGPASGYAASVSALQLLAASAALSDGTHQVALALAAGLPGISRLTMTLAVGEPPQGAAWFALGPSGTLARSAQVRLGFLASLGGTSILPGLVLRVPVYLDLAYAEAGVLSATCPRHGGAGSAVIAARPGLARLTLGELPDQSAFTDFSAPPALAPATLADFPGLRIRAGGTADIGQPAPVPLAFSASDIASGAVKRVSTTSFTQSLAASLLSSLTLDVGAFGLGLPAASSIRTAVGGLLLPLAPVLDAAIASSLGVLGMTLGAADVRVYRVSCTRPVLVG
jgi:uncharacterized membrane protein